MYFAKADTPIVANSQVRSSTIYVALIAIASFLAIVVAIDPAGDYPHAAQGPGVTLDESFNTYEGVRFFEGGYEWLIGRIGYRELFGQEEELGRQPGDYGYYNSDHPPLGRVWIGIVHHYVRSWFPPADGDRSLMVIAAARVAPAIAFSLTVFLVGWVTGRWYGTFAGVAAAASLVLMPRMFGHAHIASLESFIGLTITASVLHCASLSKVNDGWKWKSSIVGGLLFGLALLTKIQAIFVPIPFALWALWHWRGKAIGRLVLWGLVALVALYLFWPWLWLDPIGHLKAYLARTTVRETVHVWYFGQRLADVDVPWHYTLVMFVTTIPIGLLLLGVYGTIQNRFESVRRPREQLLLASLLFPLVVFALPGIAVYDGTRLFLVSYPLWAVVVGYGAAKLFDVLKKRWSPRLATALFSLLILFQGVGIWSTHPCYLSYHNCLAGGLKGANQLGLARTYWGDSLLRELFLAIEESVPAQSTIVLVPVLHNAQVSALMEQAPPLRRHGIQLRRLDQVAAEEREYILLFQRQADVYPQIAAVLPQAEVIAEVTREGVPLAGVYRLNETLRAEVEQLLNAPEQQP